MKCIFCEIAKHKIDAEIVFENEKIIAIYDIAPKAKIHILIFSKRHVADSIDDPASDGVLEDVVRTARSIARKLKVEKSGYKLITNIGPDAGQTVSHLHFHLLGGEKLIHCAP